MAIKKKIVFFLEGRNVPSSRFRVEQYVPLLKEDEISPILLYTNPNKYLWYPKWCTSSPMRLIVALLQMLAIVIQRVLQILFFVPRANVVVLQRDFLFRVSLPALEWLLFKVVFVCRQFKEMRVVFDVDDAIYLEFGCSHMM